MRQTGSPFSKAAHARNLSRVLTPHYKATLMNGHTFSWIPFILRLEPISRAARSFVHLCGMKGLKQLLLLLIVVMMLLLLLL